MLPLQKRKEVKGVMDKIKASEPTEVKVSVKENGPLISSLLVESKADGCNWLTREVAVIAGQSQVEITNTIDKIAIAKKEGIHFGFAFNVPNPVTKVDVPWGIMELEKDQLAEGNRNWIAFQRWLDVSNNNQGVTFCSLDAPVFESGDMTANIMGSATNSPEWIEKLKPSATIYSWALNNHWHTNFPLKQEGVIQFRYRLLPHSTQYNAVASNRFGMEQVQPLLACPVKSVVVSQPPLKVEGSPSIVLSVLKSNSDGKSVMVRLRSISDKDELVKLNWSNRIPKSIFIGESENAAELKNTNGALLVPAMGFTTINAIW
jgi:alpha-mannosidase